MPGSIPNHSGGRSRTSFGISDPETGSCSIGGIGSSHRSTHGMRSVRRNPSIPAEYRVFLESIGYLLPAGEDFRIETENVGRRNCANRRPAARRPAGQRPLMRSTPRTHAGAASTTRSTARTSSRRRTTGRGPSGSTPRGGCA